MTAEQDMVRPDHSLSIANDRIDFKSHLYGEFSISLQDVLVFGIYTNADGPALEDAFFVFVMKSEWFELPFGSCSDQLSQVLHERFEPFSIDRIWKASHSSQVLWPDAMAGKAIFDFYLDDNELGFLGRLMKMVGFRWTCQRLSKEVQTYIQNCT